MSWLPGVTVGLPTVTSLVLWLLARRPRAQLGVAMISGTAQLALAVQLFRLTAAGNLLSHAFGGWPEPFGIVLSADRLSGLFVLLQSVLLLVTTWTLGGGRRASTSSPRALPILFMLSAGLLVAFQTADLFNLFVAFEVVLLSSYLLLQVPGTRRSLASAFPNIVINVLASLAFFVGIAVLYGIYGTVNLADLAGRMAQLPPDDATVIALWLLAAAFSVKAGLAPLFFWLPATYPTMSGPVAALFAGMMTKLGVFALFRTVPGLMAGTAIPSVLVWLGAASALLGVLAALSEFELRRLLGFHIVSQVGYMVLGLGMLSVGAVAAAVFYLTHHILVKASLFFVADVLERGSGTRDLRQMRRNALPSTGLAVIFLVVGLSLAGLPPLSGFFAKLVLFRATLEAEAWWLLATLAVASFFTLASMLKIWNLVFSGDSDEGAERTPRRRAALAPIAVLAALSVALALLAGPLYRFSVATAEQIMPTAGSQRAPQAMHAQRSTAGGTP